MLRPGHGAGAKRAGNVEDWPVLADTQTQIVLPLAAPILVTSANGFVTKDTTPDLSWLAVTYPYGTTACRAACMLTS